MNEKTQNIEQELLWQLRDVRLAGTGKTPRLQPLFLDIRGGLTAIVGASGAGKSSLLNLLVNFEKPTSGVLKCNITANFQKQLLYYWVPQNYGLWNYLSVKEHLSTVSPLANPILATEELLLAFELQTHAHAYPEQLSQGQRSRLAVARALASQAKVLVMDEPLVNVDEYQKRKCWQIILHYLQKTSSSLIFAIHNPEIILELTPEIICLQNGKMIYDGDFYNLYHFPQNKEQAQALGKSNWLQPETIQKLFAIKEKTAKALRPELITINPNPNSNLTILWQINLGAISQWHLQDSESKETFTLFATSGTQPLIKGTPVKLAYTPILHKC